ncbi:unnamed protein product, partial [Owenia fusiformis]
EFSKDEETLESLLESISELVHTLKHAKHTGRTELTPIKLPEPEVLTNQFKLRTEYVLEEVEDDRTTPQMLGNIVAEENDQDVDLVCILFVFFFFFVIIVIMLVSCADGLNKYHQDGKKTGQFCWTLNFYIC